LAIFLIASLFSTPVQAQNCAICQQIVTFMENWIENNASVVTVEQYLEIVCTLAPSQWQAPCDAIVDYGVQEAIQWIQENENASSLCAQIGLCDAPKIKLMGAAKISKPTDVQCDICIQVIALIENWVESNYTEEEIADFLDQACSLIPGFSQVCEQIVDYGLQYIIQFIQENENSSQICQQIGLCSSRRVAMDVMVHHPKRQDPCSLCVQFFTIIKAFIGNNPNATIADLEQFAQTICALFPQYSTICQAFANSEITTIVDELEGANGPQNVCSTLGLCSTANHNNNDKKPQRNIRF